MSFGQVTASENFHTYPGFPAIIFAANGFAGISRPGMGRAANGCFRRARRGARFLRGDGDLDLKSWFCFSLYIYISIINFYQFIGKYEIRF